MSAGPFATANLGTRSGDAPDAVATNRRRLADALQLDDPAGWCWLRQVHGTRGLDADADGAPDPTADAAVTRTAGRPLPVLTADCAPVVLACDDAAAVGP